MAGTIETAIWRSTVGVGKAVLGCHGSGTVEHEASAYLQPHHLHRYSTLINTCSPSMSYLPPSTSSFQSTGRISQGAVSGDSQRQRYVSLSSNACQRVNKHDPRATDHIRHRSTFSTMIHFSTSFISIVHSFWVKARMSISV